MKKSQPFSLLMLVAILILAFAHPSTSAGVQHGFKIKEYDLFHDVLHPLQHEALPKNDFEKIRSMANELVTRGKAIVKLGIPPASPEASEPKRREFVKTLRTFERALGIFEADAQTGSDSSLKKSFTDVHDYFEVLADLVPSVYPRGVPPPDTLDPPGKADAGGLLPTVTLDCPANAEVGSKLTVRADTVEDEHYTFLWTINGGKILTGQGTRTITIETAGVAGQTISVKVEVNDGSQHLMYTKCEVQLK